MRAHLANFVAPYCSARPQKDKEQHIHPAQDRLVRSQIAQIHEFRTLSDWGHAHAARRKICSEVINIRHSEGKNMAAGWFPPQKADD
jgi:hypothetical protein